MNEIQQLNERVQYLEGIIANLLKSDHYTFNKDLWLYNKALFMDGANIQLGTSTGTKIGTAASQKIGFFGQTPKVQVATADIPVTAAGIVNTLKEFGLYQP